ncbi:MAG: hypothetical protein MUO54_00340 [Anaerolineales bacterium]|nr:hypothetical protein [Anaerolineales bacterium]
MVNELFGKNRFITGGFFTSSQKGSIQGGRCSKVEIQPCGLALAIVMVILVSTMIVTVIFYPRPLPVLTLVKVLMFLLIWKERRDPKVRVMTLGFTNL